MARDAEDGDRPPPPRRRQGSAGRPGSVHIADVAARAGVSIATVSRAIANPDRVNAKTRERVLEVVRQTGYTTNLAGRNLRVARTMRVLVVVPTLITPFFSELLLGIDRALAAEGYGFLIGNLHDHPAKEDQLVELVLGGQADGVMLLNGRLLRGRERAMADAAVPIVAVSVPIGDEVPGVLLDEQAAGAEAARHLLDLGHRRFGYITGPQGSRVELGRWRGFKDRLVEAGIAPSAIRRYRGDFHAASGVEAAERFLAEPDRPTAVFATSDMMAIAFMHRLQASGLMVPDELSVIGFDGIEFADYCSPPLTTLRQPREAMGRRAVALLVALMRGEPPPVAEAGGLLSATLRVAGSTGPAPAHARTPWPVLSGDLALG